MKGNKIPKILSFLTKTSFLIWFFAFLYDLTFFIIDIFIENDLFNNSGIPIWSFIIVFLLGSLAFFIGATSFIINRLIENNYKSRLKLNKLLLVLKFIFLFAIFPIYALIYIIKPLEILTEFRKKGMKAIFDSKVFNLKKFTLDFIILGLIIFIILPVWLVGYVSGAVLLAGNTYKNAPETILTPRVEKYESIDSPTSTPTTPPIVNTTDKANFVNDPDPIVKCEKHERCGGGYVELRKSECSNRICCEVSPNVYYSISKSQCSTLHNSQKASENNYLDELRKQLEKTYSTDTNYSIPTFPPLPDYHLPTLPPHPAYDFSDLNNSVNVPTIAPSQNDPYRITTTLEECKAKAMGQNDLLKCEILYGKYKR